MMRHDEHHEPQTIEPRGTTPGRLLEQGTLIDHFRIMRLLGRGGMGEVYLARDTELGRRVALKIIAQQHLRSEPAVRAFLAEARTTAKFSHPNIVTIYAVGRTSGAAVPDGTPFLALEHLEGESLRERMRRRQPSLRESLRISLAVARALEEAHRHGVLHLDLKPDNVIIGRDGRVRVFDFGLAKVQGCDTDDEQREGSAQHAERPQRAPQAAAAATGMEPAAWGTPNYMAPELWRRRKPQAATDIWSFGVMLFELVADQVPYDHKPVRRKARAIASNEPAPRIDGLIEAPRELADLIALCLEKSAKLRPSPAEVAEILEDLLHTGRRSAALEQSPFRGLLPYTQRHADLFFGRDEEIAAFVERVWTQSVLPVVGPSGAGKSSFVEAGIIARLREQEPWMVLRMRPGTRPFHTLASRLILRETLTMPLAGGSDASLQAAWSLRPPAPPDSEPASDREDARADRQEPPTSVRIAQEGGGEVSRLAEQLCASPTQLSLQLHTMAEQHGVKVMLFVDQLEELFTLVDDQQVRCRFMEALCCGAYDPMDPVRVVFTARDDFLGRLATGPEARDTLAKVTVIQSLGAEQLAEILERPVDALGYRFEAGLVAEMIAAVSGEPSGLPLLQFAAQRLWEERDKRRRLLLREAYDHMGGVAGALAQHADGIVETLSPEELRLARALLLRLVTPERTRKVVPRADALDGLAAERSAAAAEQVLDRLTSARLVQGRRMRAGDARGQDAVVRVELVHESLIGAWGTLRRWLDENQEGISFLAEVGQAAELWSRRGRLPHELWRGAALHQALRKLELCSSEVPAKVTEFLQAARIRERRRVRGRRLLVAAAVGMSLTVAAVAIMVALLVADKEREALRQKDIALAQRAESLREGARAALGQGNVLEARAKLRVSLGIQDSPAARALWWQLSSDPLVWRRQLGALVYDASFCPDGGTVAVASHDKAIYLLDTQTGQARILRGHVDQVFSVACAPDGKLLASGSWNGDVALWDVASGRRLRLLHGHGARVTSLAFSPDSLLLASGSRDRRAIVWQVATGARRQVLGGHRATVTAVRFHPDGRRIVTSSRDGAVRVWELGRPAPRRTLAEPDGAVLDLRFSPDARLLATATSSGAVRLVALDGGASDRILRGHAGAVNAVGFAGAELVVSGGDDKTVRLWSVRSGKPLRVLKGHGGAVQGLDVSPDGRFIASVGRDRTVRLWDVQTSAAWPPSSGHQGAVYAVDTSPDGRRIASGGIDQTVRLWDTASGAELRVLEGHTAGLWGVRFSPDGRLLASCSKDGTVRLWEVSSGAQIKLLAGHTGRVVAVDFSPDGRLLASGGDDGTVRLWELPRGREVRLLRVGDVGVAALQLSPDGRRLAAASGTEVRLFEVDSGAAIQAFEAGEEPIWGLSFSPDGGRLATAGLDGIVRVWDLATGASTMLGPHRGRTYALSFHPDGKRLGVPTSRGLAVIWNTAGKRLLALEGHDNEVNELRFSPDGKLVVTASDDGTLRLWDADTGRPRWRAPALITTRGAAPLLLTHEGWLRMAPGSSGASAGELPDSSWRRAVEQRARAVSLHGSDWMCLLTSRETIELWDLDQDRRILAEQVAGARRVLATPRGCAVLTPAAARLVDRSGADRELLASDQATAMALHGAHLLLAAGAQILDFDPAVASSARIDAQARYPASVGVTALAWSHGRLVLGYRDGNLELVGLRPGQTKPSFTFEQVPASSVVRIIEGPMNTLVLGYADGTVGLWNQLDGSRLAHGHLHGKVVHLLVASERLYAATDLGRHMVWDLSAFYASHCELLQEVRRRVPVAWEHGKPVPRPAPPQHTCN